MEFNKIYEQLIKLKFNPRRIGTKYIAEAVIYINENPTRFIEHGVYEYIAKKHNKNVFTIKSNILIACRHASEANNRTITPKFIINYLVRYNSAKNNMQYK